MKKSIVDEYPWAPRNLLNAFQESKRRSLERILDPAVSRYPLAWLPTYARTMSRPDPVPLFDLLHPILVFLLVHDVHNFGEAIQGWEAYY